MLCEQCQQPFTAFDDLQVHILTRHADQLDTFALFGAQRSDVGAGDGEVGEKGAEGKGEADAKDEEEEKEEEEDKPEYGLGDIEGMDMDA